MEENRRSPGTERAVTSPLCQESWYWEGGLTSEISADLPRPRPPYRTSEDTVSLIGRLAVHYDDSMIAKALNQRQRRTATGMSFTPR